MSGYPASGASAFLRSLIFYSGYRSFGHAEIGIGVMRAKVILDGNKPEMAQDLRTVISHVLDEVTRMVRQPASVCISIADRERGGYGGIMHLKPGIVVDDAIIPLHHAIAHQSCNHRRPEGLGDRGELKHGIGVHGIGFARFKRLSEQLRPGREPADKLFVHAPIGECASKFTCQIPDGAGGTILCYFPFEHSCRCR